jgi:hypothetical protein
MSSIRAASASLALVLLLACAPLRAEPEPLVLYDNFNGSALNPDRWGLLTDQARVLENKRLRLVGRAYSLADTNTGTSNTGVNSELADTATTASVKSLRAVVRVAAIRSDGCTANPAVSNTRARLVASLFNIGNPVAGSQAGDVFAQIFLRRFSNSADAPGVMRVGGSVDQCVDAACGTSVRIGSVDLGTADLGQAVRLSMQWDEPADRVVFQRDSDPAQPVTYAVSDAHAPGAPLKNLSVRFSVVNCTVTPRPTAFTDATFDDVFVNETALLP